MTSPIIRNAHIIDRRILTAFVNWYFNHHALFTTHTFTLTQTIHYSNGEPQPHFNMTDNSGQTYHLYIVPCGGFENADGLYRVSGIRITHITKRERQMVIVGM